MRILVTMIIICYNDVCDFNNGLSNYCNETKKKIFFLTIRLYVKYLTNSYTTYYDNIYYIRVCYKFMSPPFILYRTRVRE